MKPVYGMYLVCQLLKQRKGSIFTFQTRVSVEPDQPPAEALGPSASLSLARRLPQRVQSGLSWLDYPNRWLNIL